MDKTYTFSQIVFGLRKEYVDIEKQLMELKKDIEVGSKVEDFNFHIAGYPCKMFLYLHKKKNLLEKIEMLLGLYLHDVTEYDVNDGIKKNYYYKKKEICSISNQEELNEKIEQIIQTDFFKNIVANDHISIPCVDNESKSVLITSNCMRVFNEINRVYPNLYYHPGEDVLVMMNEEKIITPDDIFKLLDLSLDGNYLNDYHRRILNTYEEKEIDIEDSFNSRKAKLEIIEEPKKLILRPKKNF